MQCPTSVPPIPNPPEPGHTFWTACPGCKMQYAYLRTYENLQLQCPECKEVYLALDIHSTAPSNRAGGFRRHINPHLQDFFRQPASAAFNGAGPNTSAAEFVRIEQMFDKLLKRAFNGAGPTNSAADVARLDQSIDKQDRESLEAEKEVRGKEKELRDEDKDEVREESEVFRKAREAERSEEAMERLMVNRKEQEMARDAGKAKVDGVAGRKLKRKKQNSEKEDDEDLADDDPKSHEHSMQDDHSSPALPGHRPSGAKKNAAAHKVDMSDDSDLDDFPDAEQGKIEGGAEDGVKSEDEEAGLQQSEKRLKDKYVGNDRNQYGRRGVGPNSSEELDGRKHVNEKSGGDQGEPGKEDLHKKSPETFWTSCSSCKMQKEYLRQYQYYQLLCPKCKEYFLALEINSIATSNGIGGFGLDFDPHWQDFGSNNQRASAACNASDNGLKNLDQGGFNPFPNHASSAAFFSSAAAAAAQLRARVEAAAAVADAAFSAVPPKNLAADVAQKTFVKVKREKVEAEEEVNRDEEEVEKKEVEAKRKEDELKRKEDKLERKEEELERKKKELKRKEEELRKEKERLREEKEVQRKALEAARPWEVLRRLVAKHKQQEMARDARNGKADAQAVRKTKRKNQDSEQGSDEDL